MNTEVFNNINKIIERDSKTSTYKFALLRAVVDIIQDNSPYIKFHGENVTFPMGLLIEKWILYYYPILESSQKIPQITGEANLAFQTQLYKIINFYKQKGGFSSFYNDLKNKGIPKDISAEFLYLVRMIRKTLINMPMKYIGRSFSKDYYSIFQFTSYKSQKTIKEIDIEYLIEKFGAFSIPSEYYEAFKLLGSFIGGQDSILFKWAEFSVAASKKTLQHSIILEEILRNPITKREINASKELYERTLNQEGKVYCVWTGAKLTKYEIDHVIPFSIWKNNDLWNLLPSKATTNNKKRDKIPSIELIEKRKDIIIQYWHLINERYSKRFMKELKVSLLGHKSFSNWEKDSISQLKCISDYLISTRGFEEWHGDI